MNTEPFNVVYAHVAMIGSYGCDGKASLRALMPEEGRGDH